MQTKVMNPKPYEVWILIKRESRLVQWSDDCFATMEEAVSKCGEYIDDCHDFPEDYDFFIRVNP